MTKPNDATTSDHPVYGKSSYCGEKCKYARHYEHPFYKHCCWCSYLHQDLMYYDGWWISECVDKEPDKQLSKVYINGY